MTLDYNFQLMLYSGEDVSFKHICLNMLEGILPLYLLMMFKKYALETAFKCDNVKA